MNTYKIFINAYINNHNLFNVDKEQSEIINRVFKIYLKWNYIIGEETQKYSKAIRFIDYPFIFSHIFKHNSNKFIKNWREMYSDDQDVKLFHEILTKKNLLDFKRFIEILSYTKFYEISNLNQYISIRGIILANNRVSSKFNLFPNEKKIIGYYFKEDKFINILVFYNDFYGKEKYENTMGFKYQRIEDNIEANINLEQLMK
jgi:hypothetical protein